MSNKNLQAAENILAKPLVNIKFRPLAETAIATVVIAVVPMLLAHAPQNQFIVGPIVNAILLGTVLRVGLANALFIAVVPSLIALFRGMIPPQAAAAIPFIILGNCVMILAFWYLTQKNFYTGLIAVFSGSTLKTLVIFLPVWLLLNLSPIVTFMMSWPQLVTAIAGGLIAVTLNKFLKV